MMDHQQIDALMAGIAPVIRQAIVDAQKPLLERIAALESQFGDLQTKGIGYGGIWQRASEYRRGTVVTHQGSAWIALRDVKEMTEPGKDPIWQLLVKSGR